MDRVKRIINLGSSSEGNAFYLELQTDNHKKTYNLLIECGFEYKEIVKRMLTHKIDMLDIDAILVSHLHKDHSASFKDFHERDYIIYSPKSVYDHFGIEDTKGHALDAYKWRQIGDDIHVLPLPMEHHDIDKQIENFGYVIKVNNDYQILYVIDTKYIPQDLSEYQFNMMIVEANYLEQNIKYATFDAIKNKNRGNVSRYKRLVNSHFSLENLARTLDGTINHHSKPYDLSKCDIIFLTHLSSNKQTNDRYYSHFLKLFIDSTKDKTKAKDTIKVVSMKKEGGFDV